VRWCEAGILRCVRGCICSRHGHRG
jgi:hypothetical protein